MLSMRRHIIAATVALTTVGAQDASEAEELLRTLTQDEMHRLTQVTSRQMAGLLEMLFEIMTTSYDLVDYRLLDGVNFRAAREEALLRINGHPAPRYLGTYDCYVHDHQLTPLHLKMLSRKNMVNLVNCADRYNEEMRPSREAHSQFLDEWIISMVFQQLLRLKFQFEDAINILRHLSYAQITQLKNDYAGMHDATGWVKDMLMQYYAMNEPKAMHTIARMMLSDAPLEPHLENIAKPFRRQFKRLVSTGVEQVTHDVVFSDFSPAESSMRLPQCQFLAVDSLTSEGDSFNARRLTTHNACENMAFPTMLLMMGAIGCVYLLLRRKLPTHLQVLERLGIFARKNTSTQHSAPVTYRENAESFKAAKSV